MRNYYELLSVGSDAGAEEIKRAFRREIARYHPDKVAHLGPEFLHIAEARAAELTEAYRVLMDPAARAHYDSEGAVPVSDAVPPPRATPPPPSRAQTTPSAAPEPPPGDMGPDARAFTQERATRDEFLRRVSVARFREAVTATAGQAIQAGARGFDAGYHVKSKRGLFGKADPPQQLLARFVGSVDGASVEETWTLALRAGGGATASVFLMGSGLAGAAELASRIADLRRKAARTSSALPVLVPVDVRDWDALVPTEATALVKAVLARMKKHE